ncbi:hypothetical protein [Maribellus comscasis]|nr:hypothetical protein [Maribellus comscasis]
MLISGIAWTVVYIDCIRIGFKHKTYAIPLWALALNISWEIQHGIIGFHILGPSLQVVINGIWALFDIIILITFFKFGKKYFPKNIKNKWFYIWGILVLLVSFVVEFIFIVEFGRILGGGYSAFLQNLLMSVLFIRMLVQRNSAEGQSTTIAISKFVGTLAPTVLFGIVGSITMGGPNKLMLWTGILIAVIDVIYIMMLQKAKQKERLNEKSFLF